MNMLSINIRGIGVVGKLGWIKSLKENFGVSFLGLQESMCVNTHMSVLDKGFEADWVYSNGRSGGIVKMWDPKVFQKENSIISDNFLVTTGFLVDGNIKLSVVNVYAPQLNNEKKEAWQKILHVIQNSSGWWAVFGDFNSVRCREERKNTNFDEACAKDFNDFINEAGLKEFNMKGSKYTFMVNRRGSFKFNKIDRMSVCSNVVDKWPNACLRALPMNLSDHSPLVLSLIDTNFGPKPLSLV
ncbi:uncharacterized protein LOC143589399 [Bidens hawaiensis]|uniref:uncharacterized protein LOC143589399 n=1 Tax=Bidens hawaiensis TaxID=980011 RepID=UPI004049E5AF